MGDGMSKNVDFALKFLEDNVKERGEEVKRLWDWCVEAGGLVKGRDSAGIWSKEEGWLAFAYGVGRA